MYDFNPFREFKKHLSENNGQPNSSPNDDSQHDWVRGPLIKKRNHFLELVKKGEMSQEEFDWYEKMGEFVGAVMKKDLEGPEIPHEPKKKEVKEGKYDSFKECVEFYMNAKDYDKKSAERECQTGRHTFSEEQIISALFDAIANVLAENHKHKDLIKLSDDELEELVQHYTEKANKSEGPEKEKFEKELQDIKDILATRKDKE